MSGNIAKKSIKIEEGVTVNIENGQVVVNGPKGQLSAKIPQGIAVLIEDGQVRIKKSSDLRELEKFAGMIRAIISNMVTGVTAGFQKRLELSGVGYRAKVEGDDLILNIGFTQPVRIRPVAGVKITVEENTITVSGVDKQLVGDVADNIRRVRPPDPYKAKGIKYQGERIRRKVGKAAKTVGAVK